MERHELYFQLSPLVAGPLLDLSEEIVPPEYVLATMGHLIYLTAEKLL